MTQSFALVKHPEDAVAIDFVLHLCHAFIPLFLALPLGLIYSRRLRPLVSRLPVDPAAPLQASLQIVLAVGALAFAALLLAESWIRPPMMQPSFADRLNPVEDLTLRRLPGIPLLRVTVDGRESHGLVSELSLAAMLAPETPAAGIAQYGTLDPQPEHLDPGSAIGSIFAMLMSLQVGVGIVAFNIEVSTAFVCGLLAVTIPASFLLIRERVSAGTSPVRFRRESRAAS